ncbi:MAG: hypothetical protein ACFFCM_14800 [Promethearchaeota archaeon]
MENSEKDYYYWDSWTITPKFNKAKLEGWKLIKSSCPECGVKEGEYHEHGCSLEKCSGCGTEKISCICYPKYKGEKREIFINKILYCKRCGEINGVGRMVSNIEWNYITGQTFDKSCFLCDTCMDLILKWRNLKNKGAVLPKEMFELPIIEALVARDNLSLKEFNQKLKKLENNFKKRAETRTKMIKLLDLDENNPIHCLLCIYSKLEKPKYLKCNKKNRFISFDDGINVCEDYCDGDPYKIIEI